MHLILLSKEDYRVLQAISQRGGCADLRLIAKDLKVNQSALMRRLAELELKGLISITRIKKKYLQLTDEGRRYAEVGLPEVRLLDLIIEESIDSLSSLKRKALAKHFNEDEIKIGLLHLLKNKILTLSAGKLSMASDDVLRAFRENRSIIRQLLRSLLKAPLPEEAIPQKFASTLTEAKRRKLIISRSETRIMVKLNKNPQTLLKKGILKIAEVVTVLTPELIRTGKWKEVILKPFDLEMEVPVVYPGRKHPYMEFLDQVRELLLSMGFEEAKGPHVELEFWNFDVLFQAQDHPAREIHDTYFLKYPRIGRVPSKELMERVRLTHENGWITGSRGWGYKWDPRRALRLILRTQTTSVSVRTLFSKGNRVMKVFSLDRVFRPEALDATHSMEFYQCEGIVVGPNLTFRNLLGFLKEFARRLGLAKIRFKPAYFPFTEPSVEGFVYHTKLGWIEALPGGMFRPEVLAPLGIKYRVLAWGIGIDRLAMVVLGIDDIRDLFSPDLEVIRTKHAVMLPGWLGD